MRLPSLITSTKGQGSPPAMDKRLPTCRNYYWRFGGSPSPPQRPSSYLLKPHLIASSVCSDESRNPNSKYYKLRHGPGAVGQFSPLNEDLMAYHQYRVRLPFDPTPFRGVTRFAFWIAFLSILALLCILITNLLSVEDIHAHRRHHDGEGKPALDNQFLGKHANSKEGSLSDSLIFKTLVSQLNHH